MTITYTLSNNCDSGSTSPYLFSNYNITRTYDVANDGIKGFVAICSYAPRIDTGTYYYYDYYRHYVSSSTPGASSIVFTVNFQTYCVGRMIFQVMLYTKQVQLAIQHVLHTINSMY